MADKVTRTGARTSGRPPKYTQELVDTICAELAMGRSLKSVCTDKGMPVPVTVFKWLREKPEFFKQYEAAKQESADAMAEEILDLSDEVSSDRDQIARAKLRIDTRKFLMAKMKPKRYGDKLDVTSDGKALPTPIYGGRSNDSTVNKPKQ